MCNWHSAAILFCFGYGLRVLKCALWLETWFSGGHLWKAMERWQMGPRGMSSGSSQRALGFSRKRVVKQEKAWSLHPLCSSSCCDTCSDILRPLPPSTAMSFPPELTWHRWLSESLIFSLTLIFSFPLHDPQKPVSFSEGQTLRNGLYFLLSHKILTP